MTQQGEEHSRSEFERSVNAKLTRRGLLTKGAKAGLSVSAVAALGTRGAAAAVAAASAGPRRGGTATLAMSAFDPASSLDPARSFTDLDLMADAMLYDNLLKLDRHFKPHPALAEAWHVSRDARVWTFELRRGVEFHDGSPFTADDVRYTLQRIVAAKSLSLAHAAVSAVLAPSGIKVMGKHTIRLTLKEPYAFLPALIGSYNLRIVKNGHVNPKHPIGTGAFKFGSYQPGQIFTAVRNPHYWQHGLPYLDRVIILAEREEATKVQAVVSGSADVADAINVSIARQLKSNPAVQLYVLPSASFNSLAFQQSAKPFTDIRVQQALKYGTDRKRMFDAVLQGWGSIGEDIPVADTDPLHPHGFRPFPYDPDKAKSLLKSAGFSNGLPITLYTSDAAAYMVETATAFQNVVKAANINVTIRQVPPTTYWANYALKKPAFINLWLREPPDPLTTLLCTPGGGQDESQFNNAKFERLLAEARRTTDVNKQRELWAEAMPILARTSSWIIPYWGDRIWPAKPHLKGLELDFIDNADWTRAYLA